MLCDIWMPAKLNKARVRTNVLRTFFVAGFVVSYCIVLLSSYTLCVLPAKHWNREVETETLKAKTDGSM